MKSKFFFGAFAVFVLVCLFFFFFFSGIVRADELQQQAAPQPNIIVGARGVSDYVYDGYRVSGEAVDYTIDYANYYKGDDLVGYQQRVVQSDYYAPVVASVYREAAGLYGEITNYRTYDGVAVRGHYQAPAVYNPAVYHGVEQAGASQWI